MDLELTIRRRRIGTNLLAGQILNAMIAFIRSPCPSKRTGYMACVLIFAKCSAGRYPDDLRVEKTLSATGNGECPVESAHRPIGVFTTRPFPPKWSMEGSVVRASPAWSATSKASCMAPIRPFRTSFAMCSTLPRLRSARLFRQKYRGPSRWSYLSVRRPHG